MNPVIGTILLFSAILMVSLIPMALTYLTGVLFPANIEPASAPDTEQVEEPLGHSISVKKIRKNGNVIWVDATDPQR